MAAATAGPMARVSRRDPEFNELRDPVMPVGIVGAERVTLPLNPFRGDKEIALAPCPPCITLKLAGARMSAKSEAGVTVTVIVSEAARLPETPLMVNCAAPSAAEPVAVSVSVLLALVLAGLNNAVTPVGNPVAVNATVPVKAPVGTTLMAEVPLPPASTVTFEGEDERVNPVAGATVRASVAAIEMPPETPVMVVVNVPAAAEALAVNVSLLVVVALAGLNDDVTPVGNPAMVRFTALAKPFTGVTVMVLVADVPCVTLKVFGAAARVKVGPAFTVKAIVAEVNDVPEVPVTVTVEVPTAAVAVETSVMVLVFAAESGLNVAVTPLGSPLAVRVTLPVKPVLRVMVMVSVTLAPCTALRVAGDAATE